MYTGIEQLSKWMWMVGTSFLTVEAREVSYNDQYGNGFELKISV